MRQNCKNCKHCILTENSTMSPGGVMLINNYKCGSKESKFFGFKMNEIYNTMNGKTIDSRENNSCDSFKN